MKYAREKGNTAVAIVATVFLVSLAVTSYWIWSVQGSLKSSARHIPTKEDKNLTTCNNLSAALTPAQQQQHLVAITNNSERDCHLTGYPAVFVRDTYNVTIGATDAGVHPPETVTLAAYSGKAYATIELSESKQINTGKQCTDNATSTLQLYLPGLTQSIEMPFRESVCQGYTVTPLRDDKNE